MLTFFAAEMAWEEAAAIREAEVFSPSSVYPLLDCVRSTGITVGNTHSDLFPASLQTCIVSHLSWKEKQDKLRQTPYFNEPFDSLLIPCYHPCVLFRVFG